MKLFHKFTIRGQVFSIMFLVPASILSYIELRPQRPARSGFKTPSEAQWLRCRPPVNAHILNVCCAFPIGLRLALEPDLRF